MYSCRIDKERENIRNSHSLCLLSAGGVDYNELTEVLVIFSPGVSSQTVTLTTLSDLLPTEGDEELRARLLTAPDSPVVIVVPEANITITQESMYVQSKMHVLHSTQKKNCSVHK